MVLLKTHTSLLESNTLDVSTFIIRFESEGGPSQTTISDAKIGINMKKGVV